MAVAIAAATGNWLTPTTWKTADSASLLDSELANTALTTSFATSSTFTPGAIVIDAIAVKLASVAGGSGTITVALDQAGGTVAGTSVTTNVANLPRCSTGVANNEGGWYLFAFAAPVTLVGATAYGVKALVSAGASAVNLYATATTNWSRALRTTTNAAPAAGDVVLVLGQDAAGTVSSFAVTMNNADAGATVYGGVMVCKGGTLSYGVTASTNYYLKTTGSVNVSGVVVCSGGELDLGTSGAAMPGTSTGVLELNAGADGQYGVTIRNGGTLQGQGATITTIQTLLTADTANGATGLTVQSTAGWAAGGLIAIASTSRVPTDSEKTTITSVTNGTQVVIPALTAPNTTVGAQGAINHSGTINNGLDTRAEVIYLTRNVVIRNASASFGAYLDIKPGAIVALDYVEMANLGANATGQKGIEVETTTGSCTITHSSLHDTRNGGLNVVTTAGSITFSNNCLYNLNSLAVSGLVGMAVAATSGAHTFDSNWVILMGANSVAGNGGWVSSDAGSSYTNNRVAGVNGSINSSSLTVAETSATIGAFSGNVVHSGTGPGISLSGNQLTGTASNCTAWRVQNHGIFVASNGTLYPIYTGFATFGCVNGFTIAGTACAPVLNAYTSSGDVSPFAQPNGVNFGASECRAFLNACTFGVHGTHSTSDILVAGTTGGIAVCYNCNFNSTNPVVFSATACQNSVVRSQNHNGGADYRTFCPKGVVVATQAVRNTPAGYAWKMTPNSATAKLIHPGPTTFDTWDIAVNANLPVTVSVMMQYDGTYNGNMPRLVIRGGWIAGVGSVGTDVIATAAAASANAWQQVTLVVTPTEIGALWVYVDCDGTAGNLYIDDFAVSQ